MSREPITTGTLRVVKGARGDDAQYIFGPSGHIATIHAHAKPGDAALFAAANDMLGALRVARERTKHVPLSHGRRKLEALLDAAIAKAEGRAVPLSQDARDARRPPAPALLLRANQEPILPAKAEPDWRDDRPIPLAKDVGRG